MARIPRRFLVNLGSTNHCTWRSHNSTHVFELDTAKQFFLDLIKKYAPRHGIKVRAYCLMGTHPHLVVVATQGQAQFSRFWQIINHLFARWYNRQQKSRRGQVVTQRMKSPMIQPGANGRHVLTVMRYGDLNPVRAGMVPSPKDYKWSSYRHYAYGDSNDLIEDEPEYLALGRTSRAAPRGLPTPLRHPTHERAADEATRHGGSVVLWGPRLGRTTDSAGSWSAELALS